MTHRGQHARASADAQPMNGAGRIAVRQRRPGTAKHIKLQLRAVRALDKAVYGPQLAAAMDADGVDQWQLAIACGVDQFQVSRWHSVSIIEAPNKLHGRLALQAGLVNWARAVGVHEPPPVVDEPEGVRTARLCKELGDVLTVATANLATGHRDGFARGNERRELLELRAEIDRRLAVLDHEDAREAAEREGMRR